MLKNLKTNAKVITSGLGGDQKAPKGIYIGTARKVLLFLSDGTTKTIRVKPAADFNDLTYVAVVFRSEIVMNKQLYRYYLVMALSFVVDSIISYYLPYNFDKLGITIVPCVSLMMFTLLNNTIGDEHRYIFATVTGLYYAIVYANSLLIYVLLYCVYAFFGKKYTKLATYTLIRDVYRRNCDNNRPRSCDILVSVDNKCYAAINR